MNNIKQPSWIILILLLAISFTLYADIAYPPLPGGGEPPTGGRSEGDPPPPPGEGEGSGETNSFPPAYNYTNGLWLYITNVTTNVVGLTAHGTEADQFYQLLSKTNLTNVGWSIEYNFTGIASETVLPNHAATNGTQFFWARSLSTESDGDGLPDWWELQYSLTDPALLDTGDTGTADGYKDPDNDGWSNLDEYRNNTNPRTFNTPRPPQNFTANFHADGTVDLNWDESQGAVQNYTVETQDSGWNDVATVLGTTFHDASPPRGRNSAYRVRVNYIGGSSTIEGKVPSDQDIAYFLRAAIVFGNEGQPFLMVENIMPDIDTIQIRERHYNGVIQSTNTYTIAVTNFVNNLYELPTSAQEVYVRPIRADGKRGGETYAGDSEPIYDGLTTDWMPFLDGREQLKENLIFLLRASQGGETFKYAVYPGNVWGEFGLFRTDYVDVSYNTAGERHDLEPAFFWVNSDLTRPFYQNNVYRNFVYTPEDVTNDWLNTGVIETFYEPFLDIPKYEFTTNLTPMLNPTNSRWLFQREGHHESAGIFVNTDQEDWWTWELFPDYYTTFGLEYLSVMYDYRDNVAEYLNLEFEIFYPGQTSSVPVQVGAIFPEPAYPVFQNNGYYFATIQLPLSSWDISEPIPGHSTFSPTNTTRLLFASANNATTYAGYAGLSILNGDTNVPVYLGQYFDKAYKVDGSGLRSTNVTGFLSPYGEFFPTEPGKVILTTRPDYVSTNVGEAVVNVIRLDLDVNHDGTMDRTYTGDDNTASFRPFRFWVNGDNDDFSDQKKDWLKDSDDNKITNPRDLEDFARFWISGMPTMPEGYTVTLGMRYVSNDPIIKIYTAYETDGGTNYLFDTNTAFQQIQYTNIAGNLSGYGASIATISSGQSYTFPTNYFSNNTRRHFLFEATHAGSSELVLQVFRGTNVIAETSQYLELKDITEFYERAYATNVTGGLPPSARVSKFQSEWTLKANPIEAKQMMVLVHGVNNDQTEYYSSAETMFKRLYWSGYQGRFSAFKWPCLLLPNCGLPARGSPFNYNPSEYIAFKSAAAFKDYLTYLQNSTNRIPDYSINILGHSMGNIVVSEALKLGAPFDNYIISQGAVPAQCYDVNAPFLQKFLDVEATIHTPLTTAQGGYHGYFTNLTGNIVNFFNPDDFALVNGACGLIAANWEKNHEVEKPVSVFSVGSYSFDGTNCVFTPLGDFAETVTDAYEKKSMVARSRSKAIGALSNVGGILNTNGAVDLNDSFGFDDTREEHSAQFSRNIQMRMRPFYRQVLQSFEIPVPAQ